MVEIMDGKDLKQFRNKYDLTQSDLARELGYFSGGIPNRSVISRWENGKVMIGKRAELALLGVIYNLENRVRL